MGTADYDLTPGQMVGEYRIERKIGEGGFGKVYAAVHPVIGKAAAVKILNPDLAKSDEMVSRFVSEARAVNQIRHRNIIDIFAFGTLPGNLHYFVMELLEGMTLDAYLKKQGPLSPEVAFAILWPIARALQAAHKAGITHRDLKPENVFLTFDQDGGIFPKLLDFGIAKLLHEGEIAHRTRTGAMLGTPIYMSPEQCRGSHVDQRSDIYSFGILIHEVLTGGRPFTGETLMDLLMKQIAEPPPPMSSQRPTLPRSLDGAVLHMLEKMPERRPDSMQTVLDELGAAARSAGISVPGSARPSAPAAPPKPAAPPPAHVETAAWLHQQSGLPLATPTGAVQAVTGPAPGYPTAPGAGPSGHAGQSPVQGQSGHHGQSPAQGQSGHHGQSPAQGQSGHHGSSPAHGAPGPQGQGQSVAQAAPYAPTPTPQPQMSPAPPWGAALGYGPPNGPPMQGYPPHAQGGPTLQSATALPAKKSSSTIGIVAAIAAVLFFVFVVGSVGFCAVLGDQSSVEIGSDGPAVGEPISREGTADLAMKYTVPGAPTPAGGSLLHTRRRFQVKVLSVGERRALRAEISYGEAVAQTTGSDGSDQTEASPVANRTFVVVNSGGTLAVTSNDGRPVDAKERAEILNDIGVMFKPRPAIFGKELQVGDALTPPSEVVVELLGLGATVPDTTVRADNASFKLQSIDSSAGTVTFEASFLYAYESHSPAMKLSSTLAGTLSFDRRTGLLVHGALTGPVEGSYSDANGRLGVSGTLTMTSR